MPTRCGAIFSTSWETRPFHATHVCGGCVGELEEQTYAYTDRWITRISKQHLCSICQFIWTTSNEKEDEMTICGARHIDPDGHAVLHICKLHIFGGDHRAGDHVCGTCAWSWPVEEPVAPSSGLYGTLVLGAGTMIKALSAPCMKGDHRQCSQHRVILSLLVSLSPRF